MVNGYAYPHIEQRVLRQAMPYLTDLSLFSYGFREDGALVPLADSRLLAEASLFGAGAVLVLTSIDEAGPFPPSGHPICFKIRGCRRLCWTNCSK